MRKDNTGIHILNVELTKPQSQLGILKTFRLKPKKLKEMFDSLRMQHHISTYSDIFQFMKNPKNLRDMLAETEMLLLKIMSDYIPEELEGEARSLRDPYFLYIRAWAIERQMKLYQKMAQPLIEDSTCNIVIK